MARSVILLFLLVALSAFVATPALARRSSRVLNSGYPKGGSSGSSPSSSAPYSGGSPSSGSSPSGSTPSITIPPVTSSPTPVISTPSPVTIPPVTSTPSGGYGGYGSRSGMGTSGFFGRNPNRIPRLLSLVSTLAKLFGPRLLKLFAGRKPPTLMGALKDTSPLPYSSLAREGSASLVNSYAYNDFPLSASQVISQFNSALDTPELAAQQARKFLQLNEQV